MISLSTLALLLTTLTSPAQATLPKDKITARQPTPNPLSRDYLDLKASSVYASPGEAPPEACAAALSGYGDLAFPHAGFTRQLDGEIECRQRLVFKDFPTGYSITVFALTLSGDVELASGAFLERAEVGVEYFPASNSPSEVDVAVDADLRSRYAGVYDGRFSLTMNIFPGNDTARTTRGQTSCATADAQPGLELRVRLSSSHDQVGDDDGVGGLASVKNVRVGFHVGWGRCES